MKPCPDNKRISDLPVLLSVQLAAFTLFHLSQGLFFQIEFVRIVLVHEWVGKALILLGRVVFLYGPVIFFAWLIIWPGRNKVLLLGFIAITFYSAYFLHYPVVTGFLYLLGQFDSFPEFWFNNIPSISEYPSL